MCASEGEELKGECEWRWNGSGYLVIGPNGNSITLPADGWRGDDGIKNVSTRGEYWTSTTCGNEDAYYLAITDEIISVYSQSKRVGDSVRLVQNP